MAGLQRSAVSFRRQGSSGLVWDDKLIANELNQQQQQPIVINQREDPTGTGTDKTKSPSPQHEINSTSLIQAQENKQEDVAARVSPRTVGSIERSRSNGGGRGYRTGRVSPAIEPPSPKVSACGFCTCSSAFGKPHEKTKNKSQTRRRPPKPAGKRTM